MIDITSLTQEQIDIDILEFKNNVIKETNGKSLGLAIAINKDIIRDFYEYELIVAPLIRMNGFNAPTLSDIFGIKISLTENS